VPTTRGMKRPSVVGPAILFIPESPSWFQRLVDQKQVRQQRPQVNRGVQIVDQLRADRVLGENQPDSSAGRTSIRLQNLPERRITIDRLQFSCLDEGFEQAGRSVRAASVCWRNDRSCCRMDCSGRPPAPVRHTQHELIRLLDGGATGRQLFLGGTSRRPLRGQM